MYKLLALLAVFSASTAQTTTCRVATLGPSLSNMCPSGYSVISNGDCCATGSVVTSTGSTTTCADKTNAQGVNECPGLKSYCNNSQYRDLMTQQCAKTCGFCNTTPTCADLTNPNTGRSDCAANAGLCNNSLYKETMKTQCPKTCGYCK